MSDYDQLAYNLRNPLSAYLHDRATSHDLGRGTSFPTTGYDGNAVVADDRFYRTDVDFACIYDGARWLTQHTEVLRFPRTTYSANTTDVTVLQTLPTDFAVILTRMEMYTTLGATNNATNFWFYQLQRTSADVTGGLNTSLGTAGGDYQLGADLTTVLTIGGYLNVRVAKGGTGAAPSNLNVAGMVRYRLIIT